MNCYICGGVLFANNKHTVGKKHFHKNCWSRLNRKQQKLINEKRAFKAFDNSNYNKTIGNTISFKEGIAICNKIKGHDVTEEHFEEGSLGFVNKNKNIPIF